MFFKKGEACLKSGTYPKLRQDFIKTWREDPIVVNTSFSNLVGKMSKGQFVSLICLTMTVRDERKTGLRWPNNAECEAVTDWSGQKLKVLSALTDITLSTKKCKKSSQVETVALERDEVWGFTTALTVLINPRGLWLLVETTSDRYWGLASFTLLWYWVRMSLSISSEKFSLSFFQRRSACLQHSLRARG